MGIYIWEYMGMYRCIWVKIRVSLSIQWIFWLMLIVIYELYMGFIWVFMDIYGYEWVFMGMYGNI